MRSFSFNRMSWAIFLVLLSSTFVTVEIAKGSEHDNAEASHLEDPQTEPDPVASDVVETDADYTAGEPSAAEPTEEVAATEEPAASEPETEASEPATETEAASEPEAAAPETEAPAAEPEPEAAPAPAAPTCDVSSVSTTLSEKIEHLEKKVESLVSQLTGDIESKVSDLKESVSSQSQPQACPTSSDATPAAAPPARTNGNGNGNGNGHSKVEKNFEACLAALSSNNLPEVVSEWELIEKQTFGPTAKATLLKDILFLAYDKSRATCIRFVNELLNSSKKFLPPVFDVLQEAMKLNSDNLFSLASTINRELGVDSTLYKKLPPTVMAVTSGKTVKLTYTCKTLHKKLELHVRDDQMTWEREYWPVVSSNAFNLNHTKGALWTFESTFNGNFHLKNSWFGDYLWIEPNYQNLRTVDESTKSRNATEFKITLNPDSTVLLHSTFYKDAPVTEGYSSRGNTRDSFRPLRVDHEHAPIKFNVEPTTK